MCSLKLKIYTRPFQKLCLNVSKTSEITPKKNTLVSGNAGDEKNLHPDQIYFFKSIFRRYSLFFFGFFCFFCLLFFFLLVCFLKLKIYILIHILLCGRVSDNKISTRPISGIVYFFWLLFLALSAFRIIVIRSNHPLLF